MPIFTYFFEWINNLVTFVNLNSGVIMVLATVVMAVFTGLTWKLNHWQLTQYKNPTPEIYFSEPQALAISKKDKKILITFLVYFLNTGLAPIIGTGIEHRIKNLTTKEKYDFGKTRFLCDENDKPFGLLIPETYKLFRKVGKFQDLYKFEDILPAFFSEIKKRENIEIFPPYPGQRIEELWSLKGRELSEEYIFDYPWIIAPHKFKLIRWYIKVPYEDKKYYSFKIKLILHYYCGRRPTEILKFKEFEIEPMTIGDSLCFYSAVHKR